LKITKSVKSVEVVEIQQVEIKSNKKPFLWEIILPGGDMHGDLRSALALSSLLLF
jgi:hypothetical protein